MQIECLDIENTRNMRDMGGMPAAGGKIIKYGRLIRSGRISNLPEESVLKLQALNIDNIIDLRTPTEIYEHIPTLLPDAEYHYLPLVATATEEILEGRRMSTIVYLQRKRFFKEFKEYEDYMHSMYEILLFHPNSVKQLKEVFRLFLEERNCIVFHCNSGTDRTGVIAMLLESALGVDEELILQDYMASRRFLLRRRKWQKFALSIAPISIKFKNLLYVMMQPRPQYLLRILEKIKERHGSVLGYLKEVLELTDEDIESLKQNYLTTNR